MAWPKRGLGNFQLSGWWLDWILMKIKIQTDDFKHNTWSVSSLLYWNITIASWTWFWLSFFWAELLGVPLWSWEIWGLYPCLTLSGIQPDHSFFPQSKLTSLICLLNQWASKNGALLNIFSLFSTNFTMPACKVLWPVAHWKGEWLTSSGVSHPIRLNSEFRGNFSWWLELSSE